MAERSRLISASATPADVAGGGSSLDTILNVVNIAFGAGMLGLPYAIQGAGFLSGIVGMGVVLYWNFFCCSLLVQLRDEVVRARNNAVKVCTCTLYVRVSSWVLLIAGRWQSRQARSSFLCPRAGASTSMVRRYIHRSLYHSLGTHHRKSVGLSRRQEISTPRFEDNLLSGCMLQGCEGHVCM